MADTVNQTAAITLNALLSGAVNIGDKVAIGIMMPAVWDAANLTFQPHSPSASQQSLWSEGWGILQL